MKASTRKEVFALPESERISLARDLLNSVIGPVEDEDFSPENLKLIEERIAYVDAHPDDFITLEQFRKRYNLKPKRKRVPS
jgi:putative addiction module component (TIGR02574 family)